MRIAIIGAGAIGCAVAARTSRAGHDVALVVRNAERRALLVAEGLRCTELDEAVEARPRMVSALPAEPFDIIILTVKAADLPGAVAGIPAGAAHAGTRILPLVNGIPWWFGHGRDGAARPIRAVDPQGQLLARFGPDQIVGSVVYTTATMTGPATVQVTRNQQLVLGAIESQGQAAVAAMVDLFVSCGIGATLTEHIRDDVWTKVALNLATNPLSVVADASLGDLCSDPSLLPIVSAILDESWRVAARYDARPHLTRSEMIARGRAAGAFRTSMFEDFRLGRPLELGAIADAVIELGQDVGLDMPISRTIAQLARFRASGTSQENIR